ncbi:MAG: alpha/beta hydrolase [Oscillospiraceae bacterium]|nr:alpha/beta hydrolase [Oscillospiraceae bacterium]
MNAIYVILIVFGALLLLFLIASFFLFRVACGRNDKTEQQFEKALSSPFYRNYQSEILAARDWLNAQETERISVTSYDGLKLAATYLPCENARGTLLLFHGWRGGPVADFGYSLKYYHSLGLNLLLVHERAQGKSAGKYMTFGIRERRDVHTWVKWHAERFGDGIPMLLAGVSMGASTVLMACGEPFEGDVRAVFADCGFTGPKEIFSAVSRSMHLPPRLYVSAVGLWARCLAGFRLNEYSTLDAMKTMTLPVLFAHGEADSLVPCEMSKRNYEACASADKTLLLVPGAKHGQSFPVAPERYTEAIASLLDRTIGGKNARS